ncbi:flagellar motor switch protein FliM [Jeotgalibaca caeni]|uniref:flagellar motor switch protein FliM n=1 Tax=Jeotgalibaca caeni TaxID=3028623 RepID=UPI00237EB946|nr:flagellar motor switch protein FliM [Jeotgalibaca caeni]MDE1548299.1 flagellar motor switch protein FliM [Jeotgalibaca caeni]
MNPVLSQEEIDALMAGMISGEIDVMALEEKEQVKVKDYDFRRPVRLSKEYVSTLNMVFEEYAKIAENLLTTQLRSNVALELKSIEQVSFDEFLHSVPHFTMMGVFHADPQPGIQIMEMNPQICLQLIELLCGSAETTTFNYNNTKDHFTEIEQAILEEVVIQFGKAFQAAWRDIVGLQVHLDMMETNSQMIQAISPNEPVTLVTFEIEMLGTTSFLNLCIPYVFFESILDKLSLRNWFHTGKGADAADQGRLERNLQHVEVNLEVVLGKTEMSLESFLQLELGDIIPLEKRTNEPLVLSIEKEPYYLVKPGIVDRRMAVEVLQNIGGNQEE